jgi:hypothetical protein
MDILKFTFFKLKEQVLLKGWNFFNW